MELKDIVSIPGKPGLYKVFKPTRNGLIVEALASNGPKIIVNSNQRVSALKEISIFTQGDDESMPLEKVLQAAFAHYSGKTEFDLEDMLTLKTEFQTVLPNYDSEKVKPSDMKKFFKWYNIIVEFAPEVLAAHEENSEEQQAKS